MSERADSLDAAGTAETVSGDQEAPDRASGDGAAGEKARARPTIDSANLRLVGVMVVIAVLLALATIVTFVHLLKQDSGVLDRCQNCLSKVINDLFCPFVDTFEGL